jgi:hypothetical protein
MKIYNEVVRELDSGGTHYSQDLSEVDLTDPEDVKVMTNDADGEVLVHLGSSNYIDRFKIYVAHLREWRQQFEKLESVDLRYDRQIVVNPDLHGAAHQPAISAAAAKAAIAAGVKPTALVSRDSGKGFTLHSSVIPTLSQNSRKDWASSSLLTSAQKTHKDMIASPSTSSAQKAHKDGVQSASLKSPSVRDPRVARWHKRWVSKKQAAKPVMHTATANQKTQSTTALQKPSPGIPKGQQN